VFGDEEPGALQCRRPSPRPRLSTARGLPGPVPGGRWHCPQHRRVAQPSADTRIFFPQDARQRADLALRLSALCRAGCGRERICVSQQAAATAAKHRAAFPAPFSRRDRCSPVCTSCLCKPSENKYKTWGCCDLLWDQTPCKVAVIQRK